MKNTLDRISERDLRLYRKLRKNRVFNELLAYFVRIGELEGVNKSQLAQRLGKEPSQITRWFSEPGNLSLDTISDLLVAMNAEMEFRVLPVNEQSQTIAVSDHPAALLCFVDAGQSSVSGSLTAEVVQQTIITDFEFDIEEDIREQEEATA